MKKIASFFKKYKHHGALILLIGVSSFLSFFRLGTPDLNLRDEVPHVNCAVEMVESGEFLKPTTFGQNYWAKPGLACYLKVLSIGIFGHNRFAFRFWSALFLVAAVVSVYFLGKRMANCNVGFLAGMGIATCYFFLHVHGARHAVPDSFLALINILTLFLLTKAMNTNRGWLAVAIMAAMSSQVKNLSSVVPAISIPIILLWAKDSFRPNKKQIIQGIIAFVIVNLIWIVPMLIQHGQEFFDAYFMRQVVDRRYRQFSFPIDLYIARIAFQFLPWGALGILGMVEDTRKAIRHRDGTSIGIIVFFYTILLISSYKLNNIAIWYVYTMVPFLVLSAGRLLFGDDARPPWAMWLVTISCISVAGVTLLFQPNPVTSPYTLLTPLTLSVEEGIIQTRISWSYTLLLLLCGILAFGAAFKWNTRHPRYSHLFWNRCLAWSTLSIASVAAFLSCLQPLLKENHQNFYQEVNEFLLNEAASLDLPAEKKPRVVFVVKDVVSTSGYYIRQLKEAYELDVLQFKRRKKTEKNLSRILKKHTGQRPLYILYVYNKRWTHKKNRFEFDQFGEFEIIKKIKQKGPYKNSQSRNHAVIMRVKS